MGIYLNPGNAGFQSILNGFYVDKTELIDYINSTIDTTRRLTCVSRPRRFGKSYAAKMLSAYYDKGCDSSELFRDLKISGCDSFGVHLNKYDVLYLDITWFISNAENIKNTVRELQEDVIEELTGIYPFCALAKTGSLSKLLAKINASTGKSFIIIIDEWDALFREAKEDVALQKEYIQFLRGLFKSNQTEKIVKAAYMTGILPIKKYGTQSALTDFKEFTMLEPGPVAEYVGFTEEEVKTICGRYSIDFEETRRWYDGYHFSGRGHIYNPNSIAELMISGKFLNYWTQTETYESLKLYIDLDIDGLKGAIINMLGGGDCGIDTGTFQNDMTSLKSKDDVLTLLVHLGYLTYDEAGRSVSIPNDEVHEEFLRAIRNGSREELVKAIGKSDELLEATLRQDAEQVARLIDEIHMEVASQISYNNELSLTSVILFGYYSARDSYIEIRELPAGNGYADVVFIPRRLSDKPAIIVELKWNKSAEGAIAQIKRKRYMKAIENYGGDILLVAVNYEKETRRHECIIEKIYK